MKYYLRWGGNNFGDNLNDIIFPKINIFNRINFEKKNFNSLPNNLYLGLGTLLTKKTPSSLIVLGSGSDGISKPKYALDYKFVRGKLTIDFLGLSESTPVGDTAYFLKEFIQSHALTDKKFKIGIIPHWNTQINKNFDCNIISPNQETENFIKEVSQCEFILAESMHGAICADILRIPFAPIIIEKKNFCKFKWLDWASSLDISLSFGDLNNYNFSLSKEKNFEIKCQEIKFIMDNI